ncbi:hypothetical protein PHYBLDRAFT_143943 [Phycomyces blakesleeanus NRRL 1555(-)]|uniref:Uncharacterized protein n=1 Tax=Phycomyces blakesleeanus (strain ATCC 8743b / DSM 1359 / FGSC 10004 / NBRC 33097 / NRRL 1555) TaxID=763407 RepID=A0A162UEP8_PHYB8|nr:hypothetical protein PHYBLDRAFT_143943 [Phycomyces blakesleeanus NRRL 1555(-)]OAD75692.1 hypothetical protein PHYBLDRAFT_143943 [Phycomyces blakesleeanus NRRL 1555(-)]|eukprot:XP_018293732.1 hypothetical protein PHYBLDRAFT_143943 [Phycomyces blakesleeanus NRRL 1555(-)]
MNDTDNIIESLLLAIQLQLSVLRANQEQIKMDINSLGNEIMIKGFPKQNLSLFINTSSEFIFKPVINIHNVTLEHVYQMMSQHLGIKVTASKKATLRTCTKLVCNELATLPSVRALGPRPSWGSISSCDQTMICNKHANMLKRVGIDFTRCHQNWASIARVSHLWKDHQRRQL